jgi:hypothetical protein
VPALNVQSATTLTTPVFDEVKVRVPPGTLEAVVVSATVTVQVEPPVGMIALGVQTMLVDVLSLFVTVTVIVAELLVLVL